MIKLPPSTYADAAHKRPKKKKVVPTFKGDLRPPSGILRNSPVNQAKAAAAEAAARSTSSPAPAAQKNAAAVAAGGATKADLISAYNLERAKILQGMAPQIQDIYQQAGANIGGAVDASTKAAHDALYEAGGGKAAAFNDQIDPRIAASYNPDAAPNASAYLGKVLPQDTLNTQGASYGAAAAFLPAAALQEGQYALVKAIQDEKVSNADAAKVSASVSKMLGYVSDASGNPILGKNGKPIKLPAQQMTPYQQAQLQLSAGRLDQSAAATNARLKQSDDHFYAGMNFKTAKAQADYQAQEQKGAKPNAALSAKFGYIVDSSGRAILNSKGRHIPVAKPASKTSAKSRTVSDNAKIDKLAQTWHGGTPAVTELRTVGTNPDGSNKIAPVVKVPAKPGIGYQVALRKLRKQYGYNLQDAQNVLDTYWERGEGGRPYFSFQERKAISKRWPSKAGLLRKAMGGNHDAATQLAEFINAHGGI